MPSSRPSAFLSHRCPQSPGVHELFPQRSRTVNKGSEDSFHQLGTCILCSTTSLTQSLIVCGKKWSTRLGAGAAAGAAPNKHCPLGIMKAEMTERILALFGDSILDNAPYTHPEPDTTAHLERLLGNEWAVRRLATDGATMRDVATQLRAFRDRAAVAVLSVGGNDATEHIGILQQPATNNGTVLEQLDTIAEAFQHQYEAVATAVAERTNRVILCTIYDVQLEPPVFAKRVRVPLAVLNDRIL